MDLLSILYKCKDIVPKSKITNFYTQSYLLNSKLYEKTNKHDHTTKITLNYYSLVSKITIDKDVTPKKRYIRHLKSVINH